ncbi:macrolide ABC transporter ATP-binding protein [Brevibacillus agri]|uniref:ABC transporter ATP-binding protein n=1 Tax=Brevibacillus agri TaxID=51101 RepID=A0A3M8AUU0_9BACL|nr:MULTISPECIES: ABC transporter ATP-binding protein [Brevibacillus]ELK41246.1 phosphonate-transporting ATPase [Brevibacillus agri BAB-2500]MBG9566858.1 peptide ABC transporter ATP-binding protein [Brevibacillus agri]MBY0052211.1 ABC transporter ATP-binding protein [Brevibacillus agri]MCG5254240.1 ABC transporter ATP-binding protein [Brevibacillus agri]MDN4095242.1 ABC transporter ATP-binding protein [Brevibacillus agri]
MAFIELDNVSKVFGQAEYATVALKQVTFRMEKGEFVSIMGPSGSGKSTLLNIMGCMDVPTEGEYRLKGTLIQKLSDRELSQIRNKTISFVFQNFALMHNFSVYENVALPLFKRKMSLKEKKEKVDYYLHKLGIADLSNKNVSKLSGGQKQRVAIARAMTAETELILADEPTGALDQKNGAQLMELLCQMNEEGKSIVVITHDEKIAGYTKRIIRIVDGVITEDRKMER